MPEQENPQHAENATATKWCNMTFPVVSNARVVDLTSKAGNPYQKVFFDFPEGTNANGVDISGYTMSAFPDKAGKMLSAIANKEPVTVGIPSNDSGEWDKVTVTKKDSPSLSLDPWTIASALKAEREEYKAAKAAEREAERNGAATLEDAGEACVEASRAQESAAAQAHPPIK